MSELASAKVSKFDIDTLLDFSPPTHMCNKCCALNLPRRPSFFAREPISCPICRVKYAPTKEFPVCGTLEFLKKASGVSFEDPIAHCQSLARIARRAKSPNEFHPPIRSLLWALLQAKQFIHFTSYGISHIMIGALKAVAQRIDVRGLVSGADAQAASELKDYPREAPRLQVHLFGTGNGLRDVPHQKLIVIDGLVAFKGSPNLTTHGWRKVEKGMELLEVVTASHDVIELHNKLFCPFWASCSDLGDTIEMKDPEIPF